MSTFQILNNDSDDVFYNYRTTLVLNLDISQGENYLEKIKNLIVKALNIDDSFECRYSDFRNGCYYICHERGIDIQDDCDHGNPYYDPCESSQLLDTISVICEIDNLSDSVSIIQSFLHNQDLPFKLWHSHCKKHPKKNN